LITNDERIAGLLKFSVAAALILDSTKSKAVSSRTEKWAHDKGS